MDSPKSILLYLEKSGVISKEDVLPKNLTTVISKQKLKIIFSHGPLILGDVRSYTKDDFP